MAAKREKVHFETVEELLGAPAVENSQVEIRCELITPFEHHPFKVVDDDRMEELVQSIREHGVLTPVIVRPDDEGGYEMISGHRRLHAAKRAGLTTIPAIVKPMTDDDATIAMVDSNMQREEILPSERAFALKMKLFALKRQGQRTDLATDGASATEWRKLEAAEVVGQEAGLGKTQVRKYIRLTELIPELLELVDEKKINLATGVEISYLNKELQGWINQYCRENMMVRQEQIIALKTRENPEGLSQNEVIQILNSVLPQRKERGKVTLSPRKLDHYFPKSYSSEQRETIILELLDEWKRSQEAGSHV